jgi:hypothetical protein
MAAVELEIWRSGRIGGRPGVGDLRDWQGLGSFWGQLALRGNDLPSGNKKAVCGNAEGQVVMKAARP